MALIPAGSAGAPRFPVHVRLPGAAPLVEPDVEEDEGGVALAAGSPGVPGTDVVGVACGSDSVDETVSPS